MVIALHEKLLVPANFLMDRQPLEILAKISAVFFMEAI